MNSFSRTDIGKRRTSNQDSVFASENSIGPLPNLLLVADGMGGHNGGDFASSFTVRRFCELISECEDENPVILMQKTAGTVNRELHQIALEREELSGAGTTLVAACLQGQTLYAINVGDSRLYRIGKEIHQVTLDHSYVEEMARLGKLERNSEEYHHTGSRHEDGSRCRLFHGGTEGG